MKRTVKAYISFTRAEKAGLTLLASVLIILVTVRATMHIWIKPENDTEKEKKLLTAWENIKHSQSVAAAAPYLSDSSAMQGSIYRNTVDKASSPSTVNINSADSATFIRLKGIGPVTAHKIIERRKIKGPFTSIDQLLDIPRFPKKAFYLLRQHLRIR
jgi:DNA uptake protein ComE-like DNA-binding protein